MSIQRWSRHLTPGGQREARARGSTLRAVPAPWRWAWLGAFLGLVVGLVFFAPAQWLALALAQTSGARVQLLGAQGTVWNGSAQLVLAAGSGSQERSALPGRIHWRVVPGIAYWRLYLDADCCLQQPWMWTFAPRWGGLSVALADLPPDQPSVWPSAVLAGLGTPWNTLQLQGGLALQTRQLALQWSAQQGLSVVGNLQLDAVSVATSLSTVRPVGSYRLLLAGGPTPTLSLSTLEGSLLLEGSGQWIGGRLRFTGTASAAPERAAALANLLNILGPRDGARALIKVG